MQKMSSLSLTDLSPSILRIGVAVNCNNSINMYDYSKWQVLAESVATNEVIFASAWKMSSAIQDILEHVSETHGKLFLGASQKNIQQLCR